MPPEISKKSTPASSSHLMTTHCSAKLVPPSITMTIMTSSAEGQKREPTVLAVELSSNNEFVQRKLGFNGIHNFEDESGAIF